MFHLCGLAIVTADTPNHLPSDPKHFHLDWQSTLIDHFYEAISTEGRMALSDGNTSRDYCNWDGVMCGARGLLWKVHYYFKLYGNFEIHTLPSIVEFIIIEACAQRYVLETRKLPRELKKCVLQQNKLFGSVDLRTLPRKLVLVDISYNHVTGPLEVTGLPPSLEILDLRSNRIVQLVVLYDDLPKNMKFIDLMWKTAPTNRIKKVRAAHPDMAENNKAVFRNNPIRIIQ